MNVLGIDEAGRGPAIGPLVMCGVLIEEDKERELINIGVKDSKLLQPKIRSMLVKEIQKIAKSIHLQIILPEEIDAALNHPSNDLNKLELQKSVNIILESKPDKVIMDCPSPNTKSYKSSVESSLGKFKTKIVAEHKADFNYSVVGAASIIAKVTRDKMIDDLKKKHGVDFGSGYASDPKTVEFLEKNWNKEEYSELFRKTWEPWKRLKASKTQMKLASF